MMMGLFCLFWMNGNGMRWSVRIDIFPTGCFVVKNAWDMLPEKERVDASAVVIGCGPVGLCVSPFIIHTWKGSVPYMEVSPERRMLIDRGLVLS